MARMIDKRLSETAQKKLRPVRDSAAARSRLKKGRPTSNGIKKPYECADCKCTFSTESSLAIHRKMHSGKPYPCRLCNDYFTHNKVLQRHMRSHTGQKLLNCPECDKSFSLAENLQMHMNIHTDLKHFKCEESGCSAAYVNLSSLRSHIASVHRNRKKRSASLGRGKKNAVNSCSDQKRYSCPTCSETYVSELSLKFHLTLHDASKPYKRLVRRKAAFDDKGEETPLKESRRGISCTVKMDSGKRFLKKKKIAACKTCPECGRKFPSVVNLQIHMNRHLGLKPFKCKFQWCNAEFADAGTLRRHRLTVHKGAHFNCKQCEAGFKRQESLQEHIDKFHSVAKCKRPKRSKITPRKRAESVKCDICQAQYWHRGVMLKHVRIIHGVSETKREATPEQSELHLHTDENDDGQGNPHSCNVCKAKFECTCPKKSKFTLRKQAKSHKCDICQAAFWRRGVMLNHIRVVHGECVTKEKATQERSELHVKTDDNDDGQRNPYICSVCKAKFRLRSLLRCHAKQCRRTSSSSNRSSKTVRRPVRGSRKVVSRGVKSDLGLLQGGDKFQQESDPQNVATSCGISAAGTYSASVNDSSSSNNGSPKSVSPPVRVAKMGECQGMKSNPKFKFCDDKITKQEKDSQNCASSDGSVIAVDKCIASVNECISSNRTRKAMPVSEPKVVECRGSKSSTPSGTKIKQEMDMQSPVTDCSVSAAYTLNGSSSSNCMSSKSVPLTEPKLEECRGSKSSSPSDIKIKQEWDTPIPVTDCSISVSDIRYESSSSTCMLLKSVPALVSEPSVVECRGSQSSTPSGSEIKQEMDIQSQVTDCNISAADTQNESSSSNYKSSKSAPTPILERIKVECQSWNTYPKFTECAPTLKQDSVLKNNATNCNIPAQDSCNDLINENSSANSSLTKSVPTPDEPNCSVPAHDSGNDLVNENISSNNSSPKSVPMPTVEVQKVERRGRPRLPRCPNCKVILRYEALVERHVASCTTYVEDKPPTYVPVRLREGYVAGRTTYVEEKPPTYRRVGRRVENRGRKPYPKCPKCSVKFKHENDLQYHVAHCSISRITNTEDKKYFRSNKNLRKTKVLSSTEEQTDDSDNGQYDAGDTQVPLKCTQCSAEFKSQINLLSHFQRTHRPVRSRKVKSSTAVRQDEVNLPKSVTSFLSDKNFAFRCEQCDADFKYQVDLLKHVRCIHSSDVVVKLPEKNDTVKTITYSCELCNREFRRRRKLIDHVESAHGSGNQYICEKCNVSFEQKSQFEIHSCKRDPEDLFVYKCEQCMAEFNKCSELVEHVRHHSGDVLDTFGEVNDSLYEDCRILDKFEDASHMSQERFTQSHSDFDGSASPTAEWQHECGKCGDVFMDRRSLHRHLLLHAAERG